MLWTHQFHTLTTQLVCDLAGLFDVPIFGKAPMHDRVTNMAFQRRRVFGLRVGGHPAASQPNHTRGGPGRPLQHATAAQNRALRTVRLHGGVSDFEVP